MLQESILQYLRPSLSYHLSLRLLFCLFLSDHFREICNHLDGEESAGCFALFVCLSSWCLMIVVWLFLTMPWVCLQFVIVVFPDQSHLPFFTVQYKIMDQSIFMSLHRYRRSGGNIVFGLTERPSWSGSKPFDHERI